MLGTVVGLAVSYGSSGCSQPSHKQLRDFAVLFRAELWPSFQGWSPTTGHLHVLAILSASLGTATSANLSMLA